MSTTVTDWLQTALDIVKQGSNTSTKTQIADLAKANAIALGLEQVIGVRPTVIQDTTVSPIVYTLEFDNPTEAANAIVRTFDAWRGKLASGQESNIHYNFGSALVPAIVREFFFPLALATTLVAFTGYQFGKASR